jgi:cell division protein FtsI (penicillin-binding protein 3)
MRPGSIVRDQAKMTFGPQTIHNGDHKSMGRMSLRDAIAYSRNLATANVALDLGTTLASSARALYSTWKTFGIGSSTGVDVSGEVSGIAPDPATTPWQPIDLADRAFGQSVAVTPLQLANGYATMVNGGYHVQPHVVAAIDKVDTHPPAPQRAISASLADQLKGVLEHVTSSVPWYAEGSLIRGYQIGGKTGTAQVWDSAHGTYTRNLFNFSFVGFAGGDAPRAVVAVRIGPARPNAIAQGDLELIITSYQLFHRIATDALARLDVPKASDPNAGRPEPGSAAQESLEPGAYEKWLHSGASGNTSSGQHRHHHRNAGGDQQSGADPPPGGDPGSGGGQHSGGDQQGSGGGLQQPGGGG